MNRPNRFIYAGIFIICCSLLASEILLTRIFSVCLWYHFAFFVISITMFGLGLGGICVQSLPKWFKEDRLFEQIFGFALILALSIIITPLLLFKIYIPRYILQVFSLKTTLLLTVSFLLSSLPFFFGGLISSLLFRKYSQHISKLYFSDLAGASLGCLLTIPLLELCGASTAIILNAGLASLGALCFLLAGFPKAPVVLLRRFFTVFAFLIILAILNIFTSAFDVKYAKGVDRSMDEFSKWNSLSRISVTNLLEESQARWIAQKIWGVSNRFKGKLPPTRMINIDADAGTFLTHFNNDFDAVDYVQYDPPSIVHRLKVEPRTLIIGSGGGKDVLAALSFGAKHVTAVELNSIIVNDVMLDKYRKFSGNLYLHPKVKAVADEGRSFMAANKDKYDIIQLAYVDTSAATAGGAYVLAENNLYTVEGFRQYLSRLETEGIFSVCWVDVPGLAGATRLISLGIAALEELGVEDVSQHIMVVTFATRPDWRIRDILLKATPFTKEEQETVLATCRDLDFEATYIPMHDRGEIATSKMQGDKDFVKALINNKTERNLIYRCLPLNIRPTTDDSPFFFYQNHPRDFFKTIKVKKAASFVVYTTGTIVLIRVLIIGFAMVCLFYLIPMVLSAWNQKILPYRKSSAIPFLCYFSSIGFGFMILEIVFLQKLLLFLGHPLYTLSITLLSILFFAGLGSLYTQRLTVQQPHIYIERAILGLILIGIIYIFSLPRLFQFFIGYSKVIKICTSIIILMPLSFLMGMPFPLAIKVLRTRMNKIIPWMWGVNGASSVLASIVAIILAMNMGYNFTFVIGCLFYLVAFIVGRNWFHD